MLTGTEVKSLRAGHASLVDGFAHIRDGEAWLAGVHIPEYTEGTWTNHEPRRERKLLLHRAEIQRLIGKTKEGGLDARPARAVLQGRQGQGRDRAGPRQEDLRQAAGAGREAVQARDAARAVPAQQRQGQRDPRCVAGSAAARGLVARVGRLLSGAAPRRRGRDAGEEHITSYDVALTVNDDGTLGVRETIAYDFGDAPASTASSAPSRCGCPTTTTTTGSTTLSDVRVDSPTGAPTDVDRSETGGTRDAADRRPGPDGQRPAALRRQLHGRRRAQRLRRPRRAVLERHRRRVGRADRRPRPRRCDVPAPPTAAGLLRRAGRQQPAVRRRDRRPTARGGVRAAGRPGAVQRASPSSSGCRRARSRATGPHPRGALDAARGR